MSIELGAEYKDMVSGLKGIATAEHRFLNGCVQISLTPKVKDNKKSDSETWSFDVEQIERWGNGILAKKAKPKKTGGPPQRMQGPRR